MNHEIQHVDMVKNMKPETMENNILINHVKF